MTRRILKSGSGLPMNPADLPDDGTPVTFEQTLRKRVGDEDEDKDYLTPDDYDDAVWWVEKQSERGFEFFAEMDGRPYEVDVRDVHGPGTYRVTPVGHDGKPIKKLSQVYKIADPLRVIDGGKGTEDAKDTPGDLPPIMGFLLKQQQQAQERMEATARKREERRAELDAIARKQRESREERQERREWERQEREERLQRERMERDDKRSEERTTMMQTLLSGGMAIAQAMITSNGSRPQNDTNDRLLEAILLDRDKRSDSASSMRDTMELLVVLDKMAENRAAAMPAEKAEEDGDMMKSIMQFMPMLAMMKGGQMPPQSGQVVPPSALPYQSPQDPIATLAESVAQPSVMEQVLSHDPDGIASALREAISANPDLESKLVDALERNNTETE